MGHRGVGLELSFTIRLILFSRQNMAVDAVIVYLPESS